MKYLLAILVAALKEKRLHVAPFPDGTEIYVIRDAGPFTGEDEETVSPDVYIHGYTETLYGAYGAGWHLTLERLLQPAR